MFNNIGQKICALTEILFWFDVAVSVVAGSLVVIAFEEVLIGIAIILVGALLSWVSSFLLYGFGELIRTNKEIAENTDAIGSILADLYEEIKFPTTK